MSLTKREQRATETLINNYMAKERAFYCLNEQFVLNITGDTIFFHKVFGTLWKLINCQIEVWFTNKKLLSVNARPNCRKNKQLILSNDTRLFYNNSFLLKSRGKDCMTINVFQHRLPSVNCFFFPQFAFCDPRVLTTNGERNFDLQTRFSFEIFSPTNEISNEFCHLQRICQVKFRTSARNFVNGETIEASEISPKIRSPRNFADLHRIS